MFRFLLLLFILYFLHFWWTVFTPVTLTMPETIEVSEGLSVDTILKDLSKRGVIKSSFQTKVYIFLKRAGKRLQAGEYTFENSISAKQIVETLMSGTMQTRELTIRLVEGWTINEMAEYLSKNGIIPEKEFKQASEKEYPYSFLDSKPASKNLEGFLFPDTYKIFREVDGDELVKKMLETFDKKLSSELRQEVKKQERTLYEVIILASILEKEVISFEDKALSADVFLKRIKAGIGLQADSTVNYITGKKVTRASFNDIQIDSPYNTYKYRGLPPGPISNPGLESIEASVFPKKNDYWFFLTTEDGKTLFSKTLEEHNEKKRRYLE